jgi:hypothetical protein
MDVKTTFFNGELEEEIYMTQPDEFVVKGQEGKVCKLVKSVSYIMFVCRWHTDLWNNVIVEVKTFLCQSFDMKDMGKANVILNIKLIKRENEITLMQSH